MQAFISGWSVKTVHVLSFPEALNLQFEKRILVLVFVLSISTCAKASARPGARFDVLHKRWFVFFTFMGTVMVMRF